MAIFGDGVKKVRVGQILLLAIVLASSLFFQSSPVLAEEDEKCESDGALSTAISWGKKLSPVGQGADLLLSDDQECRLSNAVADGVLAVAECYSPDELSDVIPGKLAFEGQYCVGEKAVKKGIEKGTEFVEDELSGKLSSVFRQVVVFAGFILVDVSIGVDDLEICKTSFHNAYDGLEEKTPGALTSVLDAEGFKDACFASGSAQGVTLKAAGQVSEFEYEDTELTKSRKVLKNVAKSGSLFFYLYANPLKNDSLQDDIIGPVRKMFQPASYALVIIGLLWQCMRVVLSHKAEPIVTMFKSLLTVAVVHAFSASLAVLAASVSDAYTGYIFDVMFAEIDLIQTFVALLVAAATMGLLILLAPILFVIWLVSMLVFILMLVMREVFVVFMTALLPFAASGQLLRSTRPWLMRLVGAMLGVFMFKPVAASVVAFIVLMLGSKSVVMVVMGILLFILLPFAIPKMMSLFAFAGVQADSTAADGLAGIMADIGEFDDDGGGGDGAAGGAKALAERTAMNAAAPGSGEALNAAKSGGGSLGLVGQGPKVSSGGGGAPGGGAPGGGAPGGGAPGGGAPGGGAPGGKKGWSSSKKAFVGVKVAQSLSSGIGSAASTAPSSDDDWASGGRVSDY